MLQNGRHDTAQRIRPVIGGSVRRCGQIMQHNWLGDEEAVLNTSIFSNIVGMWIELPRIIIQLRLIIHIKPIYISFTTGIHFRMKCSYILIAILWNGLIALIIALLEGA